jgi:Sucrase/ferredoxin-like
LRPAYRCAEASELRSEPLYATASYVSDWLLLEQPGGWGHDAPTESRLDPQVGRALKTKAASERIRLIVVRRGTQLIGEHPAAYACHVGTDSTLLERLDIERPQDLLELNFSAIRSGRGGVGAGVDETIYLVCTHGRHDACCSIRGNLVSRALITALPGRVWESSHIGGDRFAANIVSLPNGVYYGRVPASEALELARGIERGQLDLRYYRGRCCYPFPIQAAEYFLRRDRNLVGLADLSLRRVVRNDGESVSATFDVGGRETTVTVGITADPSAYSLTCKASAKQHPLQYILLTMT